MSFAIDLVTDFSSFSINLEYGKYLSNIYDLILPMWHDKILEPKVKNKNKENIKNLGFPFFLSKKGLQYLPFIFDRYNSWF